MTIRKGEEWGRPVARPDDLVVCRSDHELAELVAGHDPRPLSVAAGDLARTIGGPGDRDRLQRVPVDLLHVRADGRTFVAVAHVVARSSWWRGPVVAVMNAEYVGDWDVAPRSHPNDGVADVVEVDAAMPVRARWQAWRRLPSGTHVPHPSISTSRRAEVDVRFERPQRIFVDGREQGAVRELHVRVEPDAFELHV